MTDQKETDSKEIAIELPAMVEAKLKDTSKRTVKKKAKLISLAFGCDLDNEMKNPNTFATSNVIATTRYTWWNFLPKSLFEQFRRIANIYFLFQATLMVLGEQFPADVFETPYGSYTVTSSLAVVVGFTMLKEAAEDRKRQRKDQETNSRVANILDASGNFEKKRWKDVKVGNIVKVMDREEIPADLIILTSVNGDGGCYVETSNIDGETNLKIRQCEPALAEHVRDAGSNPDPFKLTELRGELKCEEPNKNIHSFVGRIDLEDKDIKPIAVGSKQFLLRGSQLRNTPWIWGVVVYTGAQTKVMKNSRDAPSKLSILEQTMNQCILLVLATQFIVCAFGAGFFCIWTDSNSIFNTQFLQSTRETVLTSAWEKYHSQFFTYIVLFNNFLPISLYVTVETVLIFQAGFIESDLEMYDEESDTPASVRTSNLNSDFGQVEYIFSDKTGTLTQNVMKLQQCSINNMIYGTMNPDSILKEKKELPKETAFNDNRVSNILQKQQATTTTTTTTTTGDKTSNATNTDPATETTQTCEITGEHLSLEYTTEEASEKDAIMIDQFFTCLAVCHTVVVEKSTHPETGAVKLTYQAESPDEGALVYAACPIGYELIDRTAGSITVSLKEISNTIPDRRYEILAINGFDATRKRMSIVVRNPEGDIVVYCKGADNKMLEVLKETTKEEDVTAINHHLDQFARVGLRTLVMGYKTMTKKEYETWSNSYDTARTSVEDRDELLSKCATSIESNLTLIGASAIEDKLQDGVPDAIKKLRASGVSVWVLTGDKAETAKNIGKSCKLLTPNMQIIEIDKDDDEELDALLTKWLTVLGNLSKKGTLLERMWNRTKNTAKAMAAIFKMSKHEIHGTVDLTNVRAESLALVVHGPTALVHIFANKSLEKKLLKLGRCCKSVIACRVSPSQKAAIVRMVKYGVTPMPVTLAIGDGANDVSMIQEAHLGVGISGKEGLQAVNSSDVAIAQFRFLTKLLLVHGRWNYRRLSKVVLYSFYKNIALTVSTLMFQFFCGWSGQSPYEEIVYTGFNFFLFAPILFIGVYDQDISSATAHKYPPSYAVGRLNLDLNPTQILKYILRATLMGAIVFFIPLCGWFSSWSPDFKQNQPSGSWSIDGTSEGLYSIGTTTYMGLIWAATIKILFMQRTWTYWTPTITVGIMSVLFFYVMILFYNSKFIFEEFWTMSYYGIFEYQLKSPISWLILLLVSGVVIMVEIILQAYDILINLHTPTDTELLMAMEHNLGPKRKDGSYMTLKLRSLVKADSESVLSDDGDEDDDSETKTVRSSDDSSARTEQEEDQDDDASYNYLRQGSHSAESELKRQNSVHSGTSRTSSRRKFNKNQHIYISSKNLKGIERRFTEQQMTEMGLKNLRSDTGFDFSHPSSKVGEVSIPTNRAKPPRDRGQSIFHSMSFSDYEDEGLEHLQGLEGEDHDEAVAVKEILFSSTGRRPGKELEQFVEDGSADIKHGTLKTKKSGNTLEERFMERRRRSSSDKKIENADLDFPPSPEK